MDSCDTCGLPLRDGHVHPKRGEAFVWTEPMLRSRSRSVQRRLALQRGEPQPELDSLVRYDDVDEAGA